MTWPAALASLLGALLFVGCLGVAWTAWKWQVAASLVPEVSVKVGATLIKYAGGLTSLGSTYAGAAHRDEWFVPATVGFTCAVVWEVLDKLIDNRLKAADRQDKLALARADRESELRTELLTVFRRWVTKKTKRLARKMSDRRDNPSVTQVSAALTPDAHLEDLLQALAAFAQEQLPADGLEICNFRVGLYVDHDGVMKPLRAIDLADTTYDVFRTHGNHLAAFRRDAGAEASCVVQCVNSRRTVIVENCNAAAEQGAFRFFGSNQSSYLRSLVTYYVGTVCREDGREAEAVIALDTDLAGHFRVADRESLEFWLREFAARLKLELLLHATLITRRRTSENDNAGRKGEEESEAHETTAPPAPPGDA